MSTNFDKDYYQRFYFDPRTAVVSRAEMNARAKLVDARDPRIGQHGGGDGDAVGVGNGAV